MKIKFNSIYIIVIFTILLIISKATVAQQAPGKFRLSGKVVDSVSREPLAFITIRLKDENGTLIRAMVTRDSGLFVFKGLDAINYKIAIVAIGYQQKDIAFKLSQNTDLGNVSFKEQSTSLKEVAITAEKPIIKQKADRIIYDLQADPESRGNSLLGMMHKIPFISLDANDNILVKGNASYKVLINGKPSSMLNGNLTAILRSMPAATIQKIEVITIPPSKYDAEGLGGIINIITNKKVNDGYNGILNVNESMPVGGPGVGGSFTAKDGKLGISAFGGASIYDAPQTSSSNSRISTGVGATNLQQNGLAKSNTKNGYFGSQLSYEIDSLNLISGQFNINGNRSNGTSSLSSVLSGVNMATQSYNLVNNNTGSPYGIDAALNYQLGFKSAKNRFLTFSYQYSTNPGKQNADIGFSDVVNLTMPDYQQHDDEKFKEHTVQVDFVTPVKMVNIEAGIKGIFRKNASDFEYNTLNADGVYELNPALSDDYANTQNVFSAYNSYQITLKSWNISAGVRLEQTNIKADFISSAATANQNYLNVIPSIAAGKNFGDQTSINFGFSQRIRRPGINRLNPYVDRSDPNMEITGNPNLRPVLLNSIQAGFSSNKKLSVNIGFDYSFVNNLDLKVVDFEPSTQISRTTYGNVGKAKGLGVNYNLGYPVAKWYNISLNGNLMHLLLNGPTEGVIVSNNGWFYFVALSNSFQVTNGWRINADLNIISRNPNGLQGTSNGMVGTSFGVNKELIKNKLGFAAGIKNPFTKYRSNQNQTFGPGFSQYSTSIDYYRSISISLNYNFGGLKNGINRSKNEIKNDDLSN